MAKPGPKAKPYLAVVREGNPSKREPKKGIVLPAAAQLAEPDWREVFPLPSRATTAVRSDNTRVRKVAKDEWARVVPVLIRSVGLAEIDWALVKDYCLVVARIDQGERVVSREGMMQLGERGWQKHGWTTILRGYRTQLKAYIGELGLSPSARVAIPGADAGGDDEDDVFD